MKRSNFNTENNKISISVKELATTLSIGITAAYDLVHSSGFYPAFKVGNHILVNVDKLKQWVNEQQPV